MKKRWLVCASLLSVLALIAAACGDDTSSSTTTATTAATTTTGAPGTTAATTTLPPEPTTAFDIGVTAAPCADAVNEGNGCIYLGVISDLSTGPFAGLGQPITQAQEDFWRAVNADGGIGGFDVRIKLENTRDAHYDAAETAAEAVDLADNVLAFAQILGTPQTQGALPTLEENDIVSAPATWFSGWAFSEIDGGLIMESGAPYCFEGMNGMDYLVQSRGTDFTWDLVVFPGDYGGDYGAGAKIAAAQLGLADPISEITIAVPNRTATTAAALASQRICSRSVGPPLYQARMPPGSWARMEAKMSSEMPLPMPRFVISSPIHIRRVVPAARETTIRTMRPGLSGSAPCRLKRYAYPSACRAASTTVE